MKKNPSVLMAALTLTAIVLGVVLLATPPRQAQGQMLTNEPGLTMITSGQAQAGDELLIIIDKSSGKMLVYRLNQNSFELMGDTDINLIFRNSPTR
jgi:hypothetical protein